MIAGLWNFIVAMDASQAVASALPGATGTGTATVTLDTVTGEVNWSLSFSGTQGSAFFSHLHGASGPGVSSPARYFLTTDSSTSGSGAFTLTDPIQDMIDGLWYVNVHTTHSNQGEIRGQLLVPEPALAGLVLLAAGALAAHGRRNQRKALSAERRTVARRGATDPGCR